MSNKKKTNVVCLQRFRMLKLKILFLAVLQPVILLRNVYPVSTSLIKNNKLGQRSQIPYLKKKKSKVKSNQIWGVLQPMHLSNMDVGLF